ncbi:MAG: enoyl-CoA hydratase-related protein [Pseudomonadota bacterium]|nr:enoyl-CoA hydratase-related protein [Pseudomonadota bacterium]
MSESEVLYAVADGVAVVTMNRPDRMNAMSATMPGEIRRVMQQATDDPAVRAIVLTGAGRGFCTGADIARLSKTAGGGGPEAQPLPVTGAMAGGLDLPEGFAAKYAWLMTVPKPVIAAMNGPAAGVGVVMALFCDMRFAAEEAKYTTAFARRGLVAEFGMAWMLPRLVGPSKAFDLLCSGRVVTGAEAAAMGLVDRAMPAAEVLPAAMDYARMLAAESSPRSMARMKLMIYRSLIQSLDESQELHMDEMLAAQKCDDFREGIAAWSEKRAPRFSGS